MKRRVRLQTPIKKTNFGGAWLAQVVKYVCLDLEVMSSSPMLGIEIN